MANSNCLEGYRCPNCRAEDEFEIAVSTVVTVQDDGFDAADAHDWEWDDDAYCRCIECNYEATVDEFRTAGGRGQLLVLAINDADCVTALHLVESYVEAMAILRKVWTGAYMTADEPEGGMDANRMPTTYKAMVEALSKRWVNVDAQWQDLPAWITNAIGSEDE